MQKLLIRLGKWLESRQQIVVTPQEYQTLLQRVSTLEQSAVHKDAVKTLVLAVKEIKDEFATVKAGLGVSTVRTDIVQAMLNGHAISQGDDNGTY